MKRPAKIVITDIVDGFPSASTRRRVYARYASVASACAAQDRMLRCRPDLLADVYSDGSIVRSAAVANNQRQLARPTVNVSAQLELDRAIERKNDRFDALLGA